MLSDNAQKIFCKIQNIRLVPVPLKKAWEWEACKHFYFYRRRQEQMLKDLEKKQESQKEVLTKIQQQLEQAQVKAAIKM